MKVHFKKRGWFYIPVTAVAWIVAIVYCSVSVFTLVAIDRHYDSLVNSLIRFFPYFICFSVVYFWIAWNTSKENNRKNKG